MDKPSLDATHDPIWRSPSPAEDLILSSDEVHVWRASLDLPGSCIQRLKLTLSADELNRAERFHFQRDRHHFIVARGLLRAILGRYLRLAPHQLRFSYTPYGKPTLANETNRDRLQFNLSHSGEFAIYAMARDRRVGIDLEFVRPLANAEELAQRFFSEREHAVFRALPASLKQKAFFTCWTRKEAYIKAIGEGLSLPLDAFDVSMAPGEPAAILSAQGDPREAARWSLEELTPGIGYVATIAVEGQGWRLACWQWPEGFVEGE